MRWPDGFVRLRAPLVDTPRGIVRDWANAARHAVPDGFRIVPGTTEDLSTAVRELADATLAFYGRPGAPPVDLLPTDRVEVDGVTWRMDGAVRRFKSITGLLAHDEFRVWARLGEAGYAD